MGAPERNAKVLVVDDEEQIRRALKSILSARHYDVLVASNGDEAIDLAIDSNPDMIVLDVAMPGMDGIEVCRSLREWYTGPILFLSVRHGESDKILALDTGADDYLVKPFSAGELLARVRAHLRRSSATVAHEPTISVGNLQIDLARREVTRGDEHIDLTRIEFDILAFLARNADCVVTSKMILENVWGPEYGGDTQTLRVHVSNLRKKIEPHPSVPQYILTESGVGFRLATQ